MKTASISSARLCHEKIDGFDRIQAEVEKGYRDAVHTLSVSVLVHMGNRDDDVHVVDKLCREFPGSTLAFWIGLMEMIAEELSDESRLPEDG